MMDSTKRERLLGEIENQYADVIIIGGGITGGGIALDAVTRGMKTILVEMQDFGAGTSSRSTKLIHGGLRYLKQGEIAMVAEIGRERATVYENGPHITKPEWMLLPFYEKGTLGPTTTSIGLKIYDFLAGVKKNERRKMLNVEETLKKEPLMKQEGLKGSGYYVEYRTDDARLTIEVIKEAVRQGAKAINYTMVESLLYERKKVVGVQVKDVIHGQTYRIYGRKIVNATGPWVDDIRKKDCSQDGKTLQLSKGVHLVIDGKRFPLQQAVYYDTPDGRMIFAIPRSGKTYVGTTDTFYQGNKVHPTITEEDRNYILEAINYMFPAIHVTEKDIESSWSGIRPLINEKRKQASSISRKDEIWLSSSGLISIAGGKLTGYRKMAETVVNFVAKQLKKEYGIESAPCQTKHIPISGGHVGGSKGYPAFIQQKIQQGIQAGLTEEKAIFFVHYYGSNAERVFSYMTKKVNSLPKDIMAQLLYAIEEEMTVTPADFFVRRTGAALFQMEWVLQWKEAIIDVMAERCAWTKETKQQYRNELEVILYQCRFPTKKKKEN